MRMKNFFKTAIFAGTLAVGLTAAINFAPNVEAATFDYSNRSMNPKGQSDYGIYNGKVINIKDLYHDYVSDACVVNSYESGVITSRNTVFNNYKSSYENEYRDYTEIYADDPICAFVDKSCLRQEGDFFLMGDEYGYYVHTIKNQTYVYQSIVLLFDITYDWSYSSASQGVYQSVKLEVVSQTAVCSIDARYARSFRKTNNYDNAFLNAWVGDYNDQDDHIKYCFDLKQLPFDGWIVCPMLEKSRVPSAGGGEFINTRIKQYSKLFLTDIQFGAEYSDSNGEVSFSNATINMKNVQSFKLLAEENENGSKFFQYSKVIGTNVNNFVLGISPIGPIYSGILALAHTISECAKVDEELYQSEFLENSFTNSPIIAENDSKFYVSVNDKVAGADRFAIIGENEGNPSSITFETTFSNAQHCFTDSILAALPLRRVQNEKGDFAVIPSKITFLNNIYNDFAACSRRYMDYSKECPKMKSIQNLGDITQNSSSTKAISIEGTTPYVSRFKVTNPGTYTLSIYGQNQELYRVVIWNKISGQAVFVNDYLQRIDSSVYLSSGDYYIEISPKLNKSSLKSIEKEISRIEKEISYYCSEIDKLKSAISDKEINFKDCTVEYSLLSDYEEMIEGLLEDKADLEDSSEAEKKKLKLASASSRIVTFTTSKLSLPKPTCS